ncbi:MAG: S8 family serine peptidase [Sinobacteraceae bacterium]|nr:S8 family serine peptidase [Nevskiaceae bacterium]
MKRVFLMASLLAASGPTFAWRGHALPPYRSGEVLVEYRDSASLAQTKALQTAIGMTPKRSFAGGRIELLQLPATMDVPGALATLRSESDVKYAEPNYLRYPKLVTPNDTYFGDLWGILNTGQANFVQGGPAGTPGADLNLLPAWDPSGDGSFPRTGDGAVTVAILDNGFETTHPDLAANFIAGYDFVHNDTNVSPDSDQDDHGTEVAGALGAVGNNGIGVAGAIWNVKLLPLKFNYDLASEIQALDYAIAHGAQIVNASFGGPGYSQIEHDEIAKLGANDILFVTAAGNENSNTDFAGAEYPANYRLPNVVAVAATNRQDDIASFSTYGPVTVDVAAPGLQIVTTTLHGGYTTAPGISGTSLSTPYAAGVAALIRDYVSGASAIETRARLIEGANAGLDGASPVNRRTAGGRIDAAQSLNLAARPALVIEPQQIATYSSTDEDGNPVTVPILAPVTVINDPDGNGVLDPGETADLQITLTNLWQAATLVRGTLSASGGGVTVNSGTVTFAANLASQGSATATFNVTVPSVVTGHQYVDFSLTLTALGGYSATRHFTLELGTLADNVPQTQAIGTDLYDWFHTWHYTLTSLPAGDDTLTFQASAGNDIDIVVSYQAPPQYDIDLAVNDIPGADTSQSIYYVNQPDALLGAAPGGNEYVNIRNPQPGTYYVTVIDYDQTQGAQYTLNAFTNKGGVGNYASSTLAYQASQHQGGGGAFAPASLLLLAAAAWRRRLSRAC